MFSEKLVGKTVLVLIILYLIVFGVFFANKFQLDQQVNLALLTIVPLLFLIDGFKSLFEGFLPKVYHKGNEDLNKVTVIIPTYNGESTVGIVIEDLLRRFKKQNIIISSNGSTDDTCKIARKYGVKVVETMQPIGKVNAINVALSKVNTPYVLTLDDDTLIKDTLIPTSLLDNEYDAIAFTVIPEEGNWLTKIQGHEYKKSMEIGKFFHNKSGTVQNISGAIGLFNKQDLIEQVSTHTAEFSGEDLQRTLLIHLSKRKKGIIIQEAEVKTIVPDDIPTLFKQRVYGWYPGFFGNVFLYTKILLLKNIHFKLRYDSVYNLIFVTLLDPFRLLSLPIMIFFPVYFLAMYLVYIILELLVYLKISSKEPLWVVLIYPIYGLFGFITRICAFFVFLYRRLVVYAKYSTYLDDYKNAKFLVKALSYCISISLFLFPVLLYLVNIR